MIFYLETNFLLELALEQEQLVSARSLLDHCRAGRHELIVPSFSIAEAVTAADRRRSARNGMVSAFKKESLLLSRSKAHSSLAKTSLSIVAEFARADDDELSRLHTVLVDVATVARMIPADADALQSAASLTKTSALSFQDAVVLASVLIDLPRRPAGAKKAFVSRDRRAYDTVEVKHFFASHGCAVLTSFVAAANLAAAFSAP